MLLQDFYCLDRASPGSWMIALDTWVFHHGMKDFLPNIGSRRRTYLDAISGGSYMQEFRGEKLSIFCDANLGVKQFGLCRFLVLFRECIRFQ